MGKVTKFSGQPLYIQLLNLADRSKIRKISKNNGSDRYVKRLDGYTHFVALLFALLMRYDSLRELIIGMEAEAYKLHHLGVNYQIRRSTISDANNRRNSDFFKDIYFYLDDKYKYLLSDSLKGKFWENLLYIMDSTTITLFSTILKGAGRNPKIGKKKGGIKAHTLIKASENVPCMICYTSAATHDHCLLKQINLPKGSYITFDRAYIDYLEFERLTQQGIFYVTKMKKNLVYEELSSKMYVTSLGKVWIRERIVHFQKNDIKHKARIVEYWEEGKAQSVQLLTNQIDLDLEDVIDIYNHRWQIELLFKQLKQNFPLKYFYGESVNAIQTQIWVTLIANLLLTVVRKQIKRHWSFSNMVTMIRQMLMYYINLYEFLENPEKYWLEINKDTQKSPPEPTHFDIIW